MSDREAVASPCPFCAAIPDIGVVPETEDSPRGYFVVCPGCRAEQGMSSDRAEVITAWNRRALSPEGREGWKLMPPACTPEMLAAVAIEVGAPSDEDHALASAAYSLLPPVQHPDVLDIIAEMARDYRAMLAAAPPPSGGGR